MGVIEEYVQKANDGRCSGGIDCAFGGCGVTNEREARPADEDQFEEAGDRKRLVEY